MERKKYPTPTACGAEAERLREEVLKLTCRENRYNDLSNKRRMLHHEAASEWHLKRKVQVVKRVTCVQDDWCSWYVTSLPDLLVSHHDVGSYTLKVFAKIKSFSTEDIMSAAKPVYEVHSFIERYVSVHSRSSQV